MNPVTVTALWFAFGGFMLATISSSVFIVRQQSSAIIERLGKFSRVVGAGLHGKIPFVDRVAGRVNLRIDQMEVRIETKTSDNVFVTIPVAVQFFIQPLKVFDAYYKLSDPKDQIESFVQDIVRGKVPEIGLDDLFKSKEDVAKAVKENLVETMTEFGYSIRAVLITDIEPVASVKAEMNNINAAQRKMVASQHLGEAEKVLKVKAAEAEAESMKLHGEGIANQRAAITEGLRRSVKELQEQSPDLDSKQIMATLLMTQHYDAMRDMANSSGTRTIFYPHSPGSVSDLWQQMAMGGMAAKPESQEAGSMVSEVAVAERRKKGEAK